MKSMLVNKTYGVIPELHFAIKNSLIFLDLCELLQNFKLRSTKMTSSPNYACTMDCPIVHWEVFYEKDVDIASDSRSVRIRVS